MSKGVELAVVNIESGIIHNARADSDNPFRELSGDSNSFGSMFGQMPRDPK